MASRHRRLIPQVDGEAFIPPVIAPCDPAQLSPRFSVMIPTYNCAAYLRACLASVLSQDLGPGVMEIEVVDDCSTLDDPESVVREVAGDRVRFYRQPRNLGAVGNFNTCIERSTGELVHILHGDDVVLPGFYAAIDRLAQRAPDAGFYATRVHGVDEAGKHLWTSPSLAAYTSGPSRDPESFLRGTPLQFAGTVVRRAAYEQVGGFLSGLVHANDWEMWMRLVAATGLVCVDEALAEFRQFAASDTSRLRRTAENLKDFERLVSLMNTAGRAIDGDAVLIAARRLARQQEHRFRRAGDSDAARANHRYWAQRATPVEYLRWSSGSIRDRIRAKRP